MEEHQTVEEVVGAGRDDPVELDHGRSGGSGLSRMVPRPLVQANRLFLVVTISAALLTEPVILLLPMLVGFTALLTGWHPVIGVGRRFLKKSPESYRYENPADQRFNQWIATLLLAGAGIAFLLENPVPGFILGGMVIAAAGVAMAGFCIGCYLRFQINQWRYRLQK